MSTNFEAAIGYGFKISNADIINQIMDKEFKGFQIHHCGNGFTGDLDTFVFIDRTYKSISSWQSYYEYLNKSQFQINEEDDAKLLLWATEQNIFNPQIGWHLTTSLT